MEKKYLDEYQRKLSQMTEKEQKIRDLYLKKISNGTYLGPSTGYSFLDKPWLRCYSDESILNKTPKMTAYEFMRKCNENNMHRPALYYYGRRITYKELFNNIDRTADALLKSGIHAGDIVTICLPNVPEAVYLFYALNKIGAVPNFIHIMSSENDIKHYVNNTKSKIVFTLDILEKKFTSIKSEIVAKEIVKVAISDSLPAFKKIAYKVSNKENNKQNFDKTTSWSRFINKAGTEDKSCKVQMLNDGVASILYTGGTTSSPKGVELTNDNINNLADYYRKSGIDINNSQRFLDIIPPFVPYGLCGSIHMPLCNGVEVIMIPDYNPKKFADLIIKYKPNHVLGVPAHWENFLKDEKTQNLDLSFLVSAGCGGDNVPILLEDEVNDFFANHNCKHKLAKGYGMTELSSAAFTCLDNANDLGSVGVPLTKNNVKIIDPNTKKELQYGEIGEILITAPTLMRKYFENPELTAETIENNYGKRWIHTGDLGYMSDQGLLYIKGRLKRMIIKANGYKIYPKDIETVLDSHPLVEKSHVIGIEDIKSGAGMVPVATVIIKRNGDFSKVKEELLELCRKNLPERCELFNIYEIENMPITNLGKVDDNELKEQVMILSKK